MEALQTSAGATSAGYLLFTTSRPSRSEAVPTAEADLMRRFEREKAWATSIGMDVSKAEGWTLTGSTGTKPPFHFEEGILDDNVE
jgi:hypothetical protein